MTRFLRTVEYGFAGMTLFVFSGAALLLILSNGANEGDVEVNYDTSLYQLAFLLIYLITVLLLALRWKKSLYKLTKTNFVLGFILFAIVSILWSSAPDATLRASIKLIGSGLFGLYLSTRYSLRQLVLILAWVSGISIVLSFLFVILLPQYGVMGGVHAGTWRGVYMHKNILGSRMVISITVFLLLIFANREYRWIPWLGISLAVILLLLSKSTASLLNGFFCIAFFWILQTLRWNYRLMVLSLSMITSIAMLLMIYLGSNLEPIAQLLGKDLTFSGRSTLWAAAWEMIQRRPLLGYGFDGFWHGMDGESAYVWVVTGWKMTHAHNGFIEVWLELGLLGFLIFLLSFAQNLSRALTLVRLSSTSIAFYPVISLLLLLTSNLAESSLLSSDLACSIYVFLTIAIPKELACVKSSKTQTSLLAAHT